jgi:hypothetical protein
VSDVQILLLLATTQKTSSKRGLPPLTPAAERDLGWFKFIVKPRVRELFAGDAVCDHAIRYRISMQRRNDWGGTGISKACKSAEPAGCMSTRSNTEKAAVYTIKRLISEGVEPSGIFCYWGAGGDKQQHSALNGAVETNDSKARPDAGDAEIDERVINGKITFSTFHA